MDSRQLQYGQLDQMLRKLRKDHDYLKRLIERMRSQEFPADDAMLEGVGRVKYELDELLTLIEHMADDSLKKPRRR